MYLNDVFRTPKPLASFSFNSLFLPSPFKTPLDSAKQRPIAEPTEAACPAILRAHKVIKSEVLALFTVASIRPMISATVRPNFFIRVHIFSKMSENPDFSPDSVFTLLFINPMNWPIFSPFSFICVHTSSAWSDNQVNILLMIIAMYFKMLSMMNFLSQSSSFSTPRLVNVDRTACPHFLSATFVAAHTRDMPTLPWRPIAAI